MSGWLGLLKKESGRVSSEGGEGEACKRTTRGKRRSLSEGED